MSTDMIYVTDSTSSGDTERLGELLGSLITPPQALELVGDLGAGKTSLVRGLVRGFGGRDLATSPSFSLSNIYETDDGKIYHFDLYRLADNPGVLKNELAEALAEPKSIVVVEWGKSVEKLLPAEALKIELKSDPVLENKRQLNISYSADNQELIAELENLWTLGQP